MRESTFHAATTAVTSAGAFESSSSMSRARSDASTYPEHGDTSDVSLYLDPATVAKCFTGIIATLAVVGLTVNLVIYQVYGGFDHQIARLLSRFDLGHEPSIPAFYSAAALLLAAGLLAVIGWGRGIAQPKDVVYWRVLSIVFVALAFDEAVMFHEMVCNALQSMLQLKGALSLPWVIPAFLSAGVVGIAYLGFLMRLDKQSRRSFLIAAALFVGGAAGVEMVAAVVIESNGVESFWHSIVQTVEETCEMAGIAIFVVALLRYLDRRTGGLRIAFSHNECSSTASAS